MSKDVERLILLSGCSGGGKSSVLAELARRGFAVFEEPGRQIVKEQLARNGEALPWQNTQAFIELALSRSLENLEAARQTGGFAFFDRGIVDAYNYFVQYDLPVPANVAEVIGHHRYHRQVFLFPPWQETFENDAERRHDFETAIAEYDSLTTTCTQLGYDVVIVPKKSIMARADFILETLDAA